MMKRSVFPCVLITCLISLVFIDFSNAQNAIPASAPRPITLYYNRAIELTTKENAFIRRETMLDYENIEFSGVCKDYDMSNKMIAEGFYDHGVNTGLHTEYHSDGTLKSTLEYAPEGFIIWELINDLKEHVVINGNGKFALSCYSIEAKPGASTVTLAQGEVKGEFIHGKRNGKWEYSDKNGDVTDEETYENGTFVQRTAYYGRTSNVEHTKKSIIISIAGVISEAFLYDAASFTRLNDFFTQYGSFPSNYNRLATFPGGMKKLLLIIATGLNYALADNLIVRVIVDPSGKILKIKSGILYGLQINDALMEILTPHLGRILPAIKNGKPYTVTMRIPIGTSQEWINYLQTATDDDVDAYIDDLNKTP